jgi:hypothetical protein
MRFDFHRVLLLFSSLNVLLPPPSYAASGNSKGLCISPGGRFPPFSNEGKIPTRVKKGPKDLTFCRVFRQKTCCDVTQTHNAFMTIRRLASSGEANQECLQLWELLECSICDPYIGIRPGPPIICSSFCDRIFEACADAYFSMDTQIQALVPCGVNDFVCGRVSEWVSNGTELCTAAGFRLKPWDDDSIKSSSLDCYGGKASIDSISDSWSSTKSSRGFSQKDETRGAFEDFQQWARDMPFTERVSWAVGGMVLTAGGLLFASKRKNHNQWHKQVAVQRSARARRFEGETSPKSSLSQPNRKIRK